MRFPGSPLGVGYLAASIRSKHDVKVVDFNMEGAPLKKLLKTIREFDPHMVGFTATTPQFEGTVNMARAVKNQSDVPIIFGGNHVTVLPERSLMLEGVDLVMVREGEESFPAFLSEYEPGKTKYNTPGLGYLDENGQPVINTPAPAIEPLDNLPFVAWDLLPMEKYRARLRPFANFMFSRGCPYNCIYCASKMTHGRKIRKRSLDHIMEELRMIERDYGIGFLAIWDDILTADRDFIMDFCERKMQEGIKMEFWGNTRVDKVDPELLATMKKAGLRILTFGIETGNSATLEFIKKGTNLDQTRQAVEWTRNAGILPHGFLMINFPGETEKDIQNTIDFAFELKLPLFDMWSAVPYPKTKYEEICRNLGLIPGEDDQDFSNYWFVTDVFYNGQVPRERVRRMLADARKKMFLRKVFITNYLDYMLRGAKPAPRDFYYYLTYLPTLAAEAVRSKLAYSSDLAGTQKLISQLPAQNENMPVDANITT